MPLIILGLLTLICLLAYAIVQYISSGEEDSRPVRERYSHAFDKPDEVPSQNAVEVHEDIETYVDEDSFSGDIYHLKRVIKDSILSAITPGPESNDTIIFPSSNIEEEKRKRNIKS